MKTENGNYQYADKTTLREFLACFCADIDIFLLQDEAQQKDNDKLYTAEEIRGQLFKSIDKFTSLPNVSPALFDVPLFSTLSEKLLINMGFSAKEIKAIQKQKQK